MCSVLNFMIAYFVINKRHDAVLYCICVELLLFNASLGSIFWIYLSEIANSDSVMGLCQFITMSLLTLESSVATQILNGKIGV